jgi:hypothetical protein
VADSNMLPVQVIVAVDAQIGTAQGEWCGRPQ